MGIVRNGYRDTKHLSPPLDPYPYTWTTPFSCFRDLNRWEDPEPTRPTQYSLSQKTLFFIYLFKRVDNDRGRTLRFLLFYFLYICLNEWITTAAAPFVFCCFIDDDDDDG